MQLGTLNLRAKIKQSFCTSAKMCVKITNLCLAQKSEHIYYRTAVGNGSIWLGKF